MTPGLKALQDQAHVGVARFSDSVLLYTRQDSTESLRQLLLAVGWLLFETITATYTMVRCGISYGRAYIDQENSIFVGWPIIEAYRFEQSQLWAGAALTEAATARVPQDMRSGNADWWVLPCRVPTKGEPGFLETLAVNWTIGVHAPGFRLRWPQHRTNPPRPTGAKTPMFAEYSRTLARSINQRAGARGQWGWLEGEEHHSNEDGRGLPG